MSEYQYYEFIAIDKPLAPKDLSWVRGLSTRAEITSTRFTNTYHWGDFKGNAREMLCRGFDAHLYVSNFGIGRFMISLPHDSVHIPTIQPYCRGGDAGSGVTLNRHGKHVILTFEWEDDLSHDDCSYDESGMLATLTPNREAILRGDNRPLYLAWLASANSGLEEDECEPPVPHGLRQLSASLQALGEFLRVDKKLLKAAAIQSEIPSGRPEREPGLTAWIHRLKEKDKIAALEALLADDSAAARNKLLRRFRTTLSPSKFADIERATAASRSVGTLLADAKKLSAVKSRKRAVR